MLGEARSLITPEVRIMVLTAAAPPTYAHQAVEPVL